MKLPPRIGAILCKRADEGHIFSGDWKKAYQLEYLALALEPKPFSNISRR